MWSCLSWFVGNPSYNHESFQLEYPHNWGRVTRVCLVGNKGNNQPHIPSLHTATTDELMRVCCDLSLLYARGAIGVQQRCASNVECMHIVNIGP